MNEPDPGVSRFWEALGAGHRRDLERFGFENIKRRQAFKYFNWNWRWRQLARSEQWRFLIRHTGPLQWAKCLLRPAVLSDAAWAEAPLGRLDRLLYTFAVRLLWEYSLTLDSAGALSLPEPALGNPLPVFLRGRLISQDLANTALEVGALLRALEGRRADSFLEIGAGYGRTAYVLLSLFPEAEYTIVDIEPALSISSWYLGNLFPRRRIRFLGPAEADALPAGSVSAALSISSLQEMTPDSVRRYLDLIDRAAAGGVVYLKQWSEWFNPEDRTRMSFSEYPIPDRWVACFREPAPVQTRFTQAAWRIPAPG